MHFVKLAENQIIPKAQWIGIGYYLPPSTNLIESLALCPVNLYVDQLTALKDAFAIFFDPSFGHSLQSYEQRKLQMNRCGLQSVSGNGIVIYDISITRLADILRKMRNIHWVWRCQ